MKTRPSVKSKIDSDAPKKNPLRITTTRDVMEVKDAKEVGMGMIHLLEEGDHVLVYGGGPEKEFVRRGDDLEFIGRREKGGEMSDYTKSLGLVKVKFENPEYNYSTNVSGDTTEREARDYFIGKSFNVGRYPQEKMAKVIDIEFHQKGTYGENMEKGGSISDYYIQDRDFYIDKETFEVSGREGGTRYKAKSIEDAKKWIEGQYPLLWNEMSKGGSTKEKYHWKKRPDGSFGIYNENGLQVTVVFSKEAALEYLEKANNTKEYEIWGQYPVKKSKYDIGDKVYSWQNKDYAAEVVRRNFGAWESIDKPHENDRWQYVVRLNNGQRSKWMGEENLHKTKQKEYAEGGKINIYSKFDNDLLNHWRKQGGSPMSAYKELANLRKVGTASYAGFGIIKYDDFMDELSYNDIDILKAIKAEYNFPKLNEMERGGKIKINDKVFVWDKNVANYGRITDINEFKNEAKVLFDTNQSEWFPMNKIKKESKDNSMASGGTIRKAKVKIEEEPYFKYVTVERELPQTIITNQGIFSKEDVIREFYVDSRIIKERGGNIAGGGSVNGFFTKDGKKFINVAVGKSSPNRKGDVVKIEERDGIKWATVKFRDFSEDIRFEDEDSMEKGGKVNDVSFFNIQFALTHLVREGKLTEAQLDSILDKVPGNRIKISELKEIDGVTPEIVEKIAYVEKTGEYPSDVSMENGGEVKMLHPKDHYRNMSYNGYEWQGFWDGKHHFVRKEKEGYAEIKATDEDLTNGNIEFMAEHGLSNENRKSIGGVLLAGLLGAGLGAAAGYGYRDSITTAKEKAQQRAADKKKEAIEALERRKAKIRQYKENVKSKAISQIQRLEDGGRISKEEFENSLQKERIGNFYIIKNTNGNDGSFSSYYDGGMPFYVTHRDAVVYKAENRKDAIIWIEERMFGKSMTYSSGGSMATGDRMYNFLEDDLKKLEKAIKEGDKEEVERFFSYWMNPPAHLNPLKTKTNDRMYNFLKDDLKELEKAVSEKDNEEVERFFSYWGRHLKSLKMAQGGSMAVGGRFGHSSEFKTIRESDEIVHNAKVRQAKKEGWEEESHVFNRSKTNPFFETKLKRENKKEEKMEKGGKMSDEKKKLLNDIKTLQDAIDNSLLDDETKAKIPTKIDAKRKKIAEIEEEERKVAEKIAEERAQADALERERKLRTQSSKNKTIYIDIDRSLKEKMRNAIHAEGIPYESKTEGDTFRVFLSNQNQLDIVTRLYNEKREKLGMEPISKEQVASVVKQRVGKLKFMPVKAKPNVKAKLPVEKKRSVKKVEKKRASVKDKVEGESED